MKKAFTLVLILVLCLAMLCACGAKEEEPADEGEAGLPNPNEVVSYEDFTTRTGLDLTAPEGAGNVQWQIITISETEFIAEVDFTYEGTAYVYRAQPTAELETYDLSGLFYEWANTEAGSVGSCDAVVNTVEEAGYVSWLDIAPGINYSLGSSETGDGAKLLEVANLVFVPAQGNADGAND